ncbi:hypothetical protein [Streptomyces tsukubensis]|uniref:hypothetical protein n=1 Tax=Streptomyces tsukubensis TaxID=83656 RepID=UPI0034501537
MRQSKTVKRAVIVGATALLGITAAVGAAQANGAGSAGATEPVPAATVQHSGNGSGASAEVVDPRTGEPTNLPVRVIGTPGGGEDPVFCYDPGHGKAPTSVTFVSAGVGEQGLKTSTQPVGKAAAKGKSGDRPGFCFEPAAEK